MCRYLLGSAVLAILAITTVAQNNPPRPKTLDFDGLGRLAVATGLKTEAGPAVYKLTYPGEDQWFVELWMSKSSPLVFLTFPCQTLPANLTNITPLLQLLTQNGQMDGIYFGFNEKTKNFYLETVLPVEGLTVEKLKQELDRMQKVAIKTADYWDTSKWQEKTDAASGASASRP